MPENRLDRVRRALAAAARRRPQDNSGLPKLRPAPYLAVMHTQVTPENLRELVGRFYGRAREDALIGPVFNAAIDDWDHHLDHIAQFWAAGLLGVGRFTGRPMAKHMRQPITPPMFDRWLALWKEATDETYVPPIAQVLQARAGRIAESFKLGMFYRPAEAQ